MRNYKRILVAVNSECCARGGDAEKLTDDSEQAAARALRIAARHGASLSFVHVLAMSRRVRDHFLEASDRHDVNLDPVRKVMHELVDRADGCGIEAAFELLYGKPWEEVNNFADRHDVDLIVVGSRCDRGFLRSMMGSTSQRVMSGSSRPVMVAHDDTKGSYERVVIASDLTPDSLDVIREGLAMCFGSTCSVEVVHGVENWYDDRWYRAGFVLDLVEREHEEEKVRVREELRRQVATVAREFGGPSLAVRVESGRPESVIWQVATESDADLVVMGLAGRTGFQQFWIGDTADRVLPDLSCSILTVRPRGEDARRRSEPIEPTQQENES